MEGGKGGEQVRKGIGLPLVLAFLIWRLHQTSFMTSFLVIPISLDWLQMMGLYTRATAFYTNFLFFILPIAWTNFGNLKICKWFWALHVTFVELPSHWMKVVHPFQIWLVAKFTQSKEKNARQIWVYKKHKSNPRPK